MKTGSIEKINKIGKISYILASIAKVVFIICTVLLLIGATVCFVLPKDTLKVSIGANVDIEMNMDSFGLSEQDITKDLEGGQLKLKVQNVQFGSFDTGSNLSISDQDYTPVEVKQDGQNVLMKFETERDEFNLREVGYFLIISALGMVMMVVTVSFVKTLCKEFRDCSSPFENKIIKKMQNLAIVLIPWTILTSVIDSVLDSFLYKGVSIGITVDMGMVMVVLVILILTYIFKYGAVLQQESDETL